MKRLVLLLSLVVLLLSASSARGEGDAVSAYETQRYVIAGGGGPVEAGGFALVGTVGQAVAGTVTDTSYELCSGFWCGVGEYQLYLPLMLRNAY